MRSSGFKWYFTLLLFFSFLLIPNCSQYPDDLFNIVILYPPRNVQATQADFLDKIIISWDIVYNATEYIIYRREETETIFSEIGATESLEYTDTQIASGIKYYFYVKAKANIDDNISESSEVVLGFAGINKPAIVSATNGDYPSKISLSWSMVDNSDIFYIYRSSNGVNFDKVYETVSLSWEDVSIDINKDYYYYVCAFSYVYGLGLPSNTVTGRANFLAPENVTVTDRDFLDKIIITWDLVQHAESYYIYRADASDDTKYKFLENKNESPYEDMTAIPGNEYVYKITAFREDVGEGPDSGVSSVASCGLNDITNFVLEGAGFHTDGINLTWNTVISANEYHIYRKTSLDGIETLIATVTETNFFDSEAPKHTICYYRARAYSTLYNYSRSISKNAHYGLLQPNNFYGADGVFTDYIQLSWTTVYAADRYLIYRSVDNSTFSLLDTIENNSYNDYVDTYFQFYYYKIIAQSDFDGNSLESSIDSGYLQILAPQNYTASKGVDTQDILMSWAPVDGASTYKIYYKKENDDNYSYLSATTNTSYDFSSASRGYTYNFYVVCYDSTFGSSESSNIDSGYISGLDTPTSFSASDGARSDGIWLSWDSVPGASKYTIQVYSGYNWVLLDTTIASSYLAGAEFCETYKYRVQANSGIYGNSDYSNYDTGYLQLIPPNNFSATKAESSTAIYLNWNSLSGIDYYRIYYKEEGEYSYSLLYTTSSSSCSVYDTSKGKTYYFYVTSYDSTYGESEPGLIDSGYISGLDAPTNFSASDGARSDGIWLSWDSVPGASEYTIQVYSGYSWYRIATTTSNSYFTKGELCKILYYRVYAYSDKYGTSDYSNSDSGYRYGVPAPSYMNASTAYSNGIYLDWGEVAEADYYQLYVDNKYLCNVYDNSFFVNLDSTDKGIWYKFSVVAVSDTWGNSASVSDNGYCEY